MDQTDRRTKFVPALERGARILDLVARSKTAPGLSDLARELNIARSTVYTICQTMVGLELLIRRNDQTFQMGPHVMRWSNAFTTQSDVAAEFASIWDQETELPGATITLTVLDGAEVVYIAARNSEMGYSLIDFRAGMRLPAAFTATGKAFPTFMTKSVADILKSRPAPPSNTLALRQPTKNHSAAANPVTNIRTPQSCAATSSISPITSAAATLLPASTTPSPRPSVSA